MRMSCCRRPAVGATAGAVAARAAAKHGAADPDAVVCPPVRNRPATAACAVAVLSGVVLLQLLVSVRVRPAAAARAVTACSAATASASSSAIVKCPVSPGVV